MMRAHTSSKADSALLLTRYQAQVLSGDLEHDPAQIMLLEHLDHLLAALYQQENQQKTVQKILRLFSKEAPPSLKGLYIHGLVGRGKTMLMDWFFEVAPVAQKRRLHFHQFMEEVHERIRSFRSRLALGEEKNTDPIPSVAKELKETAQLLCFDEFTVTDIADAMLMSRLFTHLFQMQVVVVATSNVAPDNLYEGGLNRALFLPFIDILKQHVEIVRLDARTDYRLEKLDTVEVYFTPHTDAMRQSMLDIFMRLTGEKNSMPQSVPLKGGRMVQAQRMARGTAWFHFKDLCGAALGSADYLLLAREFSTIFVENIPIMNEAQRNEAKRFIMAIDALYDSHVKLVASAQAVPQALYTATYGREAFEFERTVSRLMEMRSQDYLALSHGSADSKGSGNTAGLVET
jgi:cell division protein ZapE